MSDKESKGLADVRQNIDKIDEQIQQLLTQRATCAQEVARIKRESGEVSDFYRPEREAQVLRLVADRNEGPLRDTDVMRIFREIMSSCLALQQPLTIAFLGPEGTFTQAAVLKHFGHGVNLSALPTFEAVFREVEAGAAHYGVLPVENSTEGVVRHTLDRFVNSPLKIVGEVDLRVHQHLVSQCESLNDIKRVYSHQQGLAQTRAWLDANLPNAERIEVSSTAEAARMAAEEKGAAAVAGASTADIYQLKHLAHKIEDEPFNTTRFLVIGPQAPQPSGKDKTSLLISSDNVPGGLYALLKPLAEHKVDMSRIESRPSRKGNWEYIFFIDILGHSEDENVKSALAEVASNASLFKVLGSYPVAAL